jgi:hypothetical protein
MGAHRDRGPGRLGRPSRHPMVPRPSGAAGPVTGMPGGRSPAGPPTDALLAPDPASGPAAVPAVAATAAPTGEPLAGRGVPRQAGGAGAWGRTGHPSRCLTVVHDGERLGAVSLWLAGPRAVHLGDQVGWPRGGLAPSATYVVRLVGAGYLSVVGGTLLAWEDRPGAGPVLTPAGELDRPIEQVGAKVVPLHRLPPASAGPMPENCPYHHGALRVAGEQDSERERDRLRREQAAGEAVAAAQQLLAAAVRPDGSPDPESLVHGVTLALTGDTTIGPFAQRLAAGLPGPVLATLLEQLGRPRHRPSPAPRAQFHAAAPGDFEITYRVLAQRALAVHGDAVLGALPARLVAEGMAAEALVLPRLERLLERRLPGELGRMARWSLHGLDEPFADVDPEQVRIALLALGVVF